MLKPVLFKQKKKGYEQYSGAMAKGLVAEKEIEKVKVANIVKKRPKVPQSFINKIKNELAEQEKSIVRQLPDQSLVAAEECVAQSSSSITVVETVSPKIQSEDNTTEKCIIKPPSNKSTQPPKQLKKKKEKKRELVSDDQESINDEIDPELLALRGIVHVNTSGSLKKQKRIESRVKSMLEEKPVTKQQKREEALDDTSSVTRNSTKLSVEGQPKRARVVVPRIRTTEGLPAKTKGLRGVLKSRQHLEVKGVPTVFETPEPKVINDYWVYFPLPTKTLFRDLLSLDPLETPPRRAVIPPEPVLDKQTRERIESFGEHFESLQKERAELLQNVKETQPAVMILEKSSPTDMYEFSQRVKKIEEFKSRAGHLGDLLLKMEKENQEAAFQWSKTVFFWRREKDRLEEAQKIHARFENERKADVLAHVQHGMGSHRKHINNVQKSVLEVELIEAVQLVGGEDGKVPEITEDMSEEEKDRIYLLRSRISTVLDILRTSSSIKLNLSTMKESTDKVLKPLRSHVPLTKGKYIKSGSFTKEKRAEKVSSARPYKKSGKHINDFQNPRFPKQRDSQIIERARQLGVSVEEFRTSVMGK